MALVKQEILTNAHLKRKFHNPFDLANYAIEMARTHIKENAPMSLKEIVEDLNNLSDIEKEEIPKEKNE